MSFAQAPLDEMALTIAGAFRPVNAGRARARLDLLGQALARRRLDDPTTRAQALVETMTAHAGFAVDDRGDAEALMLDRVLTRSTGHPLSLAIVYAAVAKRAGFDLHVIGARETFLLGDPESDPPLAIDPIPGGRVVRDRLWWLCPHMVGLRLLDEISERYARHGDLRAAILAAELRLLLPVDAGLHRHHELELTKLRAQLN